jgi:hypothetical protein
MICRIATESDIAGILDLQSKNLYTNLSELERKDGFVTTPFTSEQVRSLIAQTGVFVAEKEGAIVGYVFAGSWDYFAQWPIFPLMVSRFPQLSFHCAEVTADDTFQYGPVCIDRQLRGSGAFVELFEMMRSQFALWFPVGVTFINQRNERSLVAHTRKLGLEIIDEFEFGGNSFYGLAFSTRSSVQENRAAGY